MTISVRPHAYKVRVFKPDQAYGDPYCAVLLVTWQGPDVVEIDLAHGEMTKYDVLDIYKWLVTLGVRILRAWRADNHRLPFGSSVRTEGRFTLWEVDLPRAIPLLERACRQKGPAGPSSIGS